MSRIGNAGPKPLAARPSGAPERSGARRSTNYPDGTLEAGSSLDHTVRVHYIFADKADFEPCWPVFQKYLGEARPAATMFVAGLLDERMKLEIEITARLPST